ncbi:MAG TPA: chromosome partitioning protein ParA, partial [Rhodospirillaceae bacterium]|nr:chromosome partitioning protein ParA [Rhodospirillaceae bacterium]
AQTASAMRLEQRNRLVHLREKIKGAEKQSEEAQTTLQETTSILQQCQALDQQTRQALQAAFAALNDARTTFEQQKHEVTEAHTKLNALDETAHEIVQDMDILRARAVEIEQERTALPHIEELQTEIASKRIELSEAREKQARQQSKKDGASSEHNRITTRLESVEEELEAWQERMKNAETQSVSLRERIAKLESNLIALHARPAELDQKRDALMSELSEAEKKRSAAADILIETEQKLSASEHKLKTEEENLGTAREERVRAEAAVTAIHEHLDVLRERMDEKLKCAPENLREIAAFKEEEDSLPNIFELEQLLGRFNRERENMGPVNLRAEVETENAKTEIDKLTQEKEDLTAAIGKLRQGIGKLNHEARERLNNAFSQVNERFQKLFTSLFSGGTAYLELIDNEDPMNAGLEIFAAPPGKKQQILSLLSGGERTLTALALLFAVFQTNPSPICVLDEAEAALDESNITRFCELVQMIGKETKTRFLIITHQRLTMAHMDRLFGVTMSEKGVSQLVSVDLAGAVALRDGEEASEETEAKAQATETLKAVQAA